MPQNDAWQGFYLDIEHTIALYLGKISDLFLGEF